MIDWRGLHVNFVHIRHTFRTRFWRTATLVNALIEAKNKGELSLFMKQFEKLDLLICDEWGRVTNVNKVHVQFTPINPCSH